MNAITKAAIFASTIALTTPAWADHTPDYVEVESLQYAGTGCPAGSVWTNISSDRKAVKFIFDSFIAEIGPGVSRAESRKNCQLSIDLSYPRGWSFTIDEGQVSGYVALDDRVNATQVTKYYFQGQAESASLYTNFYGPTNDDYLIYDDLGREAEVWSPCGAERALQINMQARLTSRSRYASGLMTIDGPDGRDLKLKWRRCD